MLLSLVSCLGLPSLFPSSYFSFPCITYLFLKTKVFLTQNMCKEVKRKGEDGHVRKKSMTPISKTCSSIIVQVILRMSLAEFEQAKPNRIGYIMVLHMMCTQHWMVLNIGNWSGWSFLWSRFGFWMGKWGDSYLCPFSLQLCQTQAVQFTDLSLFHQARYTKAAFLQIQTAALPTAYQAQGTAFPAIQTALCLLPGPQILWTLPLAMAFHLRSVLLFQTQDLLYTQTKLSVPQGHHTMICQI